MSSKGANIIAHHTKQRKNTKSEKNAAKKIEKIVETKVAADIKPKTTRNKPRTGRGHVKNAATLAQVSAEGSIAQKLEGVKRADRLRDPAFVKAFNATFSRLAPHKCPIPARIPDPYPFPTGIFRYEYTTALNTLAAGDGSPFVVAVVRPFMNASLAISTGYSPISYTWQNAPTSTIYTMANTEWVGFRMVGVRVAMYDVNPAQNRSGQYYCGNTTWQTANSGLPASIADITSSEFYRIVPDQVDSQKTEDSTSTIVLMIDSANDQFRAPSWAPSQTTGDTAFFSGVTMLYYGTPGVSPRLYLKVTYIIEYIPYAAYVTGIDNLETCVGDPSLMGQIMAEIFPDMDYGEVNDKAADFLNGFWEDLVNGAKKVFGWVETGVDTAQKIVGTVKKISNAIVPFMGPLGLAATQKDYIQHLERVIADLKYQATMLESLNTGKISWWDYVDATYTIPQPEHLPPKLMHAYRTEQYQRAREIPEPVDHRSLRVSEVKEDEPPTRPKAGAPAVTLIRAKGIKSMAKTSTAVLTQDDFEELGN